MTVVEPPTDVEAQDKLKKFMMETGHQTPILRVEGAASDSHPGEGTTWDAGKWHDCGPTVLAQVNSGRQGEELYVAIFNLADYADIYVKAFPDPKLTQGKPPDL